MKQIYLFSLLTLLFLSACETDTKNLPEPKDQAKSNTRAVDDYIPPIGERIGSMYASKKTVDLYFYITEAIVIDWGDQNTETLTEPGMAVHTYAEEGSYSITIHGSEKAITDFGSMGNGLERLEFTKSNDLKIIEIRDETISTLDFTGNPVIGHIMCEQVNLQNLILNKRNFYYLEFLWCAENQLTSLDLTKVPYLKSLDCSSNNLSDLNVSRNKYLYSIQCSNNPFLSDMASLTSFANSLPDRSGDTQGGITLNDSAAADAIRSICSNKNWNITVRL